MKKLYEIEKTATEEAEKPINEKEEIPPDKNENKYIEIIKIKTIENPIMIN